MNPSSRLSIHMELVFLNGLKQDQPQLTSCPQNPIPLPQLTRTMMTMMMMMSLAAPVRGVAIRAQQQRNMIMLAPLDGEDHHGLGEEGLVLAAKVGRRVECESPAGGCHGGSGFDLAEDVVEGVDGDFARRGGGGEGEPGFDAAVFVCGGFEFFEDASGWSSGVGRGSA